MGGSGGGGSSGGDGAALRRAVDEELRRQELTAELNAVLAELLAGLNDRDAGLVRDRLDQVQEALGDDAIDVDRLLFGGSVAKHTYVDGLSDVDALVVVDAPSASPADLVERFARALRSRLPMGEVESVEPGRLAVTVTYADGTQLQLLPAVERDGRTSIASEDGDQWRRIRPHKFAEKLTAANRANGDAVVPAIKLAKSAIAGLPEAHRLSGYHVEAIAVDAFRNYDGRRDRASVLHHLVDHAARAVLRPTGDITGQSVHVDDHLGAAGSARRREVSASLARLAARLRAASSAQEYRRIFDHGGGTPPAS